MSPCKVELEGSLKGITGTGRSIINVSESPPTSVIWNGDGKDNAFVYGGSQGKLFAQVTLSNPGDSAIIDVLQYVKGEETIFGTTLIEKQAKLKLTRT